VSARIRVFVAGTSDEKRRRIREEATHAGWVIVDQPGDADLVIAPIAAWRAETDTTAGSTQDREDRPVESLTPRELEVLVLLADGVGNREIASRLDISEHTVKFHLSAIFGKLGASTRTDAVRRALRSGLIDL
jgi:DNA-binding CsgD family transcriptional regulator